MSGENERCSLQIRIRQRLAERIDGRRRGAADLGGPVVEVNVGVAAWLQSSPGCDLLALVRRERMGRAISQRIEELLLHAAAAVRWRRGAAAGWYPGPGLYRLLRGWPVRT